MPAQKLRSTTIYHISQSSYEHFATQSSFAMSDTKPSAPVPPTELGRYRILSSTAGIRVSPLQLGAMSIGDAWSNVLGSTDKTQSFKLLDAFVEAGGNFIDTVSSKHSLLARQNTEDFPGQ